ncbi:MAG TPA: SLC13 family permease [Phycisphaerales bacterium]|nr:SLC13 family permease [Phycisphaerales bacterium]HMP38311.1 SLC13 family permease [Phycisphaerales bacterium]
MSLLLAAVAAGPAAPSGADLRLWLVLGLLAAAIVMFAINRPRMDVVALMMLVALPLTGTVSVNEALAGFSDPNIVLIAALFVLGDGLVRTGVARNLGDWLIARTGSSETLLLVLLMVVVCGVGSIMSSTAVTAIFIPVAMRIAASTGTSPSRLMMPLSFAALISGMMTLIATAPNLVVSAELERQGERPFSFFAFAPFGVPVLIAGIAYMLVARRFLGESRPGSATTARRPSLRDWISTYDLGGREYRVRIGPRSPLVGRTLEALSLPETEGMTVIAIERTIGRGTGLIRPSMSTDLHAGDILMIDLGRPAREAEAGAGDAGDDQRAGAPTEATRTEITSLCERFDLETLPLDGAYFGDHTQELGMAEVIVPAESDLIGKTIAKARFRSRTGLTVIGLRRGTEPVSGPLLDERLAVGDTLLVVGAWKDITRLGPDDAGVLIFRLPAEIDEVLAAPGRAWFAVGTLAVVIGLMVSGVVANVIAALLGCLMLGAFRCITIGSAYRAIDWKTIVLIVGMLPFAIALKNTGGVELAANAVASLTENAGPRLTLAAIFAATALLGMFMSNTATAVLMAPVAITIATTTGQSPQVFAMIVALAASTAFVTPVSSPVNTLVVTPGNYSFGDFVKVGGPFALVVLVISVVLVPIFIPG